jgi:hypothetical protein
MGIFRRIWKRLFKKKERHDYTPDSAFKITEDEEVN